MNDNFELFEHARKRAKQKKWLYSHFIFFLVGSVFLIILNKFLNVIPQYDWFVWAIVIWFFLFIIHFINVFITHNFMGKEWEKKQIEKLVLKQETKIAKLEKGISKEAQLKFEIENQTTELKKKETPPSNEI